MFQRSPVSSLRTRRTAFAGPPPTVAAARTQERFPPPVMADGPIWPVTNPDHLIHRQPGIQNIVQMQRILDSGVCAIQDSKLSPSRPNSDLIPANACDSAHGRRLETTARYKLVAPSWPRDRSSRAGCRGGPEADIGPTYGRAPDAPEPDRGGAGTMTSTATNFGA